MNYFNYIKDFLEFKRTDAKHSRFPIKWSDRYPCLNENTFQTAFDRHYTYHLAWAARIIKELNPQVHVDISSSLQFCTILSAFIPTKFYDFRPPDLTLNNLQVEQADLISLKFADNSIVSLSCMHTVEHIGLGRYGDKLDPDGDIKAIEELIRVLAIGGNLLFVVPIGKPKIVFNAHRIYSYEQISDYFKNLKIMEFTLIPDNKQDGNLVKNPSKQLIAKQKYGCGCFWFNKFMSNKKKEEL